MLINNVFILWIFIYEIFDIFKNILFFLMRKNITLSYISSFKLCVRLTIFLLIHWLFVVFFNDIPFLSFSFLHWVVFLFYIFFKFIFCFVYLRYTRWCFDVCTHSEMVSTIKQSNITITLHSSFFVVRTLKVDSLANFQYTIQYY